MSRIRLTAVLTAGVLAVGATAAGAVPAAKKPAGTQTAAKKAATPKPKKIYQACVIQMAQQIPSDATTVSPADADGTYYGATTCGGKLLGSGVQYGAFFVPDDGSIHVHYTQYFSTGTVKGVFVLTPDSSETGDPTADFTYQHFTGTITVTGGSGAHKGIRSAKTGSISCSTTDAVHLTCVERIKMKVPPTATK